MQAETPLQPTAVVTAFLRHDQRILLVQRSARVGSYQGRWSAISGYLEEVTPLQQARREISEETGLPESEVHLVAAGEAISIPAPELGRLWVVHPFLFDVDDPQHVRLDWENLTCCWVAPHELHKFNTVPGLDQALQACLKR